MAAPVITTVPTLSFTKGTAANLSITGYASDPDLDPLSYAYTGAGLPPGVIFNATLGRYEYDGTGNLTTTDAVNGAQFSADDTPVSVSAFAFAEIPEIVFIRGFAETEQLGCFHLDQGNRWTPGDLTRTSGWTSRNLPTLVVTSGVQPANLTYNTATGVLTYTAAGEVAAVANLTLTCHLHTATLDSADFRIRILSPTVIWGTTALTYTAKPGWTGTPARSAVSFDVMQGGGANVDASADATTDLLTFATGTDLAAGNVAVRFITAGTPIATIPNPLKAATTYWTIPVSATTCRVASSLANAQAGTALNLTQTVAVARMDIQGLGALTTTATDAAPNVLLALGGTYTGENVSTSGNNFQLGNDRNYLYLLGDPSNKPTWQQDTSWSWITRTSAQGNALLYLKNMTWKVMSLSPGANAPESNRTTLMYLTKMLFRDPNPSGDVFGYSNQEWDGGTTATAILGTRTTHLWSSEFFDAGGNVTTHMLYGHGRPGGQFYFNNLIMRGGNDCQQLKGTGPIAKFRNSFFSCVQHPPYVPAASSIPTLNDMTIGNRSNAPIDWVNCADTVVFNCDFSLAFQAGAGATSLNNGSQDGAIFMRCRRELHGSEVPAYPFVSGQTGGVYDPALITATYNAGTTACLGNGYFTGDARFTWVQGFDGTPATFKSAAFWAAIAAAQPDITSAAQAIASAFTFKHFVSYCTFRWLLGGVGAVQQYSVAYSNDGTYPRRAVGQFSNGSYVERAEVGWRDRACDFFANNTFTGWQTYTVSAAPINAANVDNLMDFNHTEQIDTVEAGAQWPRTTPPQFPQRYIVGGHGYGAQAAFVALPAGFLT